MHRDLSPFDDGQLGEGAGALVPRAELCALRREPQVSNRFSRGIYMTLLGFFSFCFVFFLVAL